MWLFLFSTMLPLAPDWEVDNMLKYYSGKHEGKPIKDGKKWTVVLPKNAHATPA